MLYLYTTATECDKFIIIGLHTVLTFFLWQKDVSYCEALRNENPYQCMIQKDLVQLKHALYPMARYVVITSS
jgi:hypothetical protein